MKRSGFTLIELVVVMGIIGILAGLVVENMTASLSTARDARRKAELRRLEKAILRYQAKNGNVPVTPDFYSSEKGDLVSNGLNNDGNWIPGLVPNYIAKLPKDPLGGTSAFPACATAGWKRSYLYRGYGQTFKLLAACSPENPWTAADPFYDPQRPNTAWMVCSEQPGCSW